MSHTPEQKEWLERRKAIKDGKANAYAHFVNLALDNDGDLMMGMTYSHEWQRYTCTYTQSNGVRDFGGSRAWDNSGLSLDDSPGLNLKTVHEGVRKI